MKRGDLFSFIDKQSLRCWFEIISNRIQPMQTLGNQELSETIRRTMASAAAELRRANRVLFITGAGISADSGLPTYRGVGGLYNTEKTEEGYSIEQCLSASMFQARPDITWKYMLQVGKAVIQCRPNPAHEIIAKWEKEFAQRSGKVVVLTQNIDGYHRLAGSENVLEIHGTLEQIFCTHCMWETTWDLLRKEEWDSAPKCPKCSAVMRPRIILFEERLPREVLMQFDEEFDGGNGFDMVFSIGTSAMFPYIIAPVAAARVVGKTTVEINPTASELSHRATYPIPLGAAEAMTQLDALFN